MLEMTTTQDVNQVLGGYVKHDGEEYYQITNCHLMPEFFMSLVGPGDHWMFISSHGALTAGRRNSDQAIFPYASDDQISAARGSTGPMTLLRVNQLQDWKESQVSTLWEPFLYAAQIPDGVRRNLYKTALGTKLIFEEVNDSLGLTFRYRWAFSEQFGFVRSCCLTNTGSSLRSLDLLDGLVNVLPDGISADFQMRFSNLGNAYKKSELLDSTGIGLFYLSSIPSDRAEPSEGLRATTVWQTGLTPSAVLLSREQISGFCQGRSLRTEVDVRGKVGAYLINQSLELSPGDSIRWTMVCDNGQDHSDVIARNEWLSSEDDIQLAVDRDVQRMERQFIKILSSSDGFQVGANRRWANRHLSNTVFNVMRGGLPLDNYRIPKDDFLRHVSHFNRAACERNSHFLEGLPESLTVEQLRSRVSGRSDSDLLRLTLEYLPFAFSRRHGDPTRPWNRFSIDLHTEDGSTSLNYQGNWRDIFQNWEALGVSFPCFLDSMVCRFLNATTADGYNPYRLTKQGFEWEEPAPEDPWANIGYWGDHQIVYLLKLLERVRAFDAGQLDRMFQGNHFVHANVPYRILDCEQIRRDPRNTIEFDTAAADVIEERVREFGADGKLMHSHAGEIHYVSLIEKLLTLSLAKISNFVPDGGVWLNTQRPEWNDANNALVGNGLSVVTTCYLRRWCWFIHRVVSEVNAEEFPVSVEVSRFFRSISSILKGLSSDSDLLSSKEREQVVVKLTRAGSEFRSELYQTGLSGEFELLSRTDLCKFFADVQRLTESTIRKNQRSDGLYHSYNILKWNEDGIEIEHLSEMLEGQVAVLSSRLLSGRESAQLLKVLRSSHLYRADQNSYLLYPDRQLPRFLDKNLIHPKDVSRSPLLQALVADGDETVVRQDVLGGVHYCCRLKNSGDLKKSLSRLPSRYRGMALAEEASLVEMFEDTFGHRQFTGRSGAFFAYEGLGSIYWHMVSKLALAVSDTVFVAVDAGEGDQVVSELRSHLREIRAGIGAEKSPSKYGGFPSDPYSHTPENAGGKQPGMTGQVKEDILSRFAQIGAHVENGCLRFRLDLFDRNELLTEADTLECFDLSGELRVVDLPRNSFGFTMFQVPIVYLPSHEDRILVEFSDSQTRVFAGTQIDAETSRFLFSRTGYVKRVEGQFRALMD